MTRNKIILNETQQYLDSHSFTCLDDLLMIEDDLIRLVNDKIDEHNIVAAKDEKYRKLTDLAGPQIALVVQHVFNVKLISFTEESDRRDTVIGVYIDDMIIQIVPDANGKQGTYDTSRSVLETLARYFNFTISKKEMEEFFDTLNANAPMTKRCLDRDLIAVNNGIFNYATKQLQPFSPDLVFVSKAQVSYNPNAQNVVIHNPDDGTDWDVESWMKSLAPVHPEIAEVLWEITGAIIRPNVAWSKSAWLYSESGNNGKGTLCEMYRAILGNGSFTSIPLSDFSKDFALMPLLHCSAIIVDENDVGTFIDKAGNLKSVITNDVVQVNRKFETPVAFQFRGFMVQCLNEYPKVKDKSDSFFRRQLFVPMEACFSGSERKYIKTDYLHRQEVLEYILKRVLHMNYYTLSEPECCKMALQEFKENNSPVITFWEEMRDQFAWSLLPFTFLWDLYQAWFANAKPNGVIGSSRDFSNDLIRVIQNDEDWYCNDKSKQITANKSNMGMPEPLIYEYGLGKWINTKYKGSDIEKICMPNLKQRYAGIQRYSTKGGTDDE